ncbi:MAG: hypothetical protein KJO43_12835, partial [Phycisphaerae bacterium]|nr:hypothetical protein [Phycisphaerae bacterium]
ILSTNRIMIGKNVMVEGPLGSRYGVVAGELSTANGDPLVMRSDFYFLDPALSGKLDTLYQQIADHDVDGDGRLRPAHPTESAGLGGFPDLVDYDGDEYVDDFDLFMDFFDDNSDFMVVYDDARALAAGLGSLAEELVDGAGDPLDTQLARLIDEARPDRDGDGLITASDTGLGYMDGVIDGADLYAKVTGSLAFAVAKAAWEAEHGESYQTVVEGPIRPGIDAAPVEFAVPDEELLEITTGMFDDSQSWFAAQVPGSQPTPPSPDDLPTEAIVGGTYTPPAGQPWEAVPFGSAGAYDYYQRPHYEDMTFRNVRIHRGNNGLFENCTFVGVTFVESERQCSHVDWNYAGAVEEDGSPRFDPPLVAELPDSTPVPDSRLISNNIRFHNCTFLGSIAGDRLDEYTHWRNKIQMTGNTRFYIDPNDPDLLAQPDAATLQGHLNGLSADDRTELAKSSILMPGWSVDVGNFDNEQAADPADTPSVNLRGVIISGILDVRGTADVLGTLLMTFRPADGAGPLFYGGQPDAFNTTIGYFGPDDGDDEGVDPLAPGFPGFGEIRLRYNPDALLPDGIPWPVQMEPVPDSYVEGGFS